MGVAVFGRFSAGNCSKTVLCTLTMGQGSPGSVTVRAWHGSSGSGSQIGGFLWEQFFVAFFCVISFQKSNHLCRTRYQISVLSPMSVYNHYGKVFN